MKIVSGGQTGVDTAALEFAREHSFLHGGWVPKGRTNEEGVIPEDVDGLRETESEDVAVRTRKNVEDSDATLVFSDGSLSPGTQKTVEFAEGLNRPYLVVDVRKGVDQGAQQIRKWMSGLSISVLNVAGPRKSESPALGAQVKAILEQSLLPA